MRRRLVPFILSAALLVPALAHGQDFPGRIVDVGFTTRDVAFRTIDLQLEDTEVAGATLDLAVEETETEIRIELSADILFDFDRSDIKDEAATALEQVAAMIGERPGSPVRIEGHTDSKGSDAYNEALSEDRALSVMDWLTDNGGLASVAFEIVGVGETMPKAPNENADGSDNPEGRQANRRVEIVIGK
jgi:outer membrane protein OmpA-like peptidoglycan-associated protein